MDCSPFYCPYVSQPLKMGAVPVVFGAPNVRDYMPSKHAVILVEDFSSMKELGQYLTKAGNDESIYNKHIAWKKEPFPPGFQYRIDHALNPFCSVCEHIKERGVGLGQKVVDERPLGIQLHEATQAGDINKMKKLVASGADINFRDGVRV